MGEVLLVFREAWAEEYGSDYLPTPADKSQLGRILRSFPDKAAIAAFPWDATFRAYLADKSRWVAEEHRHSLRLFCMGGLNKYRVRAGTEGYSAREIRGIEAARQFAGEGEQ